MLHLQYGEAPSYSADCHVSIHAFESGKRLFTKHTLLVPKNTVTAVRETGPLMRGDASDGPLPAAGDTTVSWSDADLSYWSCTRRRQAAVDKADVGCGYRGVVKGSIAHIDNAEKCRNK